MPNATLGVSSMTNLRLAEAFLERAGDRLASLQSLRAEADFSDVIREARDITELCFRGMLRILGVEVSRWMDLGEVLTRNIRRLPADIAVHGDRLLEIYADLKNDRPSVPTDEANIPPEKLLQADADRAVEQAQWVLGLSRLTVDIVSHRRVPAPQS